jgi:hypothetical protein
MLEERKRRAIKEAVTDTVIGTAIMFPLNYLVVYVTLDLLSFNSFQITISSTVTLFFVAVWRKATIRLYFEKKYDARTNTGTVEQGRSS